MTSGAEIGSVTLLRGAAEAIDAATGISRRLARAVVDIETAGAAMLEAVAAAGTVLPPVVVAAAERIRAEAAAARASLPVETVFAARYAELRWNDDGKGGAAPGADLSRGGFDAPGAFAVRAAIAHASLATLQLSGGDGGPSESWTAFGPRTAICPLERVHYAGKAMGVGAVLLGGALYSLAGTMDLDFDFPAGTFVGQLALTGTDRATGATRVFGPFVIAQGLIGEVGSLDAQVQGAAGTWLGFFEGSLHGPESEEFGAAFGFATGFYQTWDPARKTAVNIAGATIGRRNS